VHRRENGVLVVSNLAELSNPIAAPQARRDDLCNGDEYRPGARQPSDDKQADGERGRST
jgi:hypothetical protein